MCFVGVLRAATPFQCFGLKQQRLHAASHEAALLVSIGGERLYTTAFAHLDRLQG